MGADRIAKIIREEALARGIPIVEDRPLARSLYAGGRVEDFVPADFLEPVAEILKWAKRLEDAQKEESELDAVTLDDLPPQSGGQENEIRQTAGDLQQDRP